MCPSDSDTEIEGGFTAFSHRRSSGFESAAKGIKEARMRAEGAVSQNLSGSRPGAFPGRRNVSAGLVGGVQLDEPVRHRMEFDGNSLSKISDVDRRWAWIDIDLHAFRDNILSIQNILEPGVKFLAVIKADAYGHGAVACASIAQKCGVDYLGVATVDEAVELREAEISTPILILSEPPVQSIPFLVAYDVMPSIYTPEFAIKYGEACASAGKNAPYHLAVNTGMNRIGVRYNEVIDFFDQVSFHKALRLVGTFTHFATADQRELLDFRLQQQHFLECLDVMQEHKIDPGIVHAANSAATLRFPDVHYNMVRVGISLYGSYPDECLGIVDLKPVMSVHARITDVKTVPVGEGVSYGLRYRSNGFARICTVPIGYADGLRRGLSGKIEFIYEGRACPQVGAICMDQCMFEVDMRSRRGRGIARSGGNIGRKEPQIGDEVIILGSAGNAVVTVEDMAARSGTIPYEIMIGLGTSRLPKVYV